MLQDVDDTPAISKVLTTLRRRRRKAYLTTPNIILPELDFPDLLDTPSKALLIPPP
jgi:hypothetical protein